MSEYLICFNNVFVNGDNFWQFEKQRICFTVVAWIRQMVKFNYKNNPSQTIVLYWSQEYAHCKSIYLFASHTQTFAH